MNYKVNVVFDAIKNEDTTVLITGEVDNVYILNRIETDIYELFGEPSEIEDSYRKFTLSYGDVSVSREDFYAFVQQLIEKQIITKAND